MALRIAGDDVAAIDYFVRATEVFRRRDDLFHTGWAMRMLGRTELMLGRADEAREHLRESMAIFVDAGDLWGVALHLADFCFLSLLSGQESSAFTLFGAMEMVRRISQTDLVHVTINLVPGIDEALARGGPQAMREVGDLTGGHLEAVGIGAGRRTRSRTQFVRRAPPREAASATSFPVRPLLDPSTPCG